MTAAAEKVIFCIRKASKLRCKQHVKPKGTKLFVRGVLNNSKVKGIFKGYEQSH